MDSAGPRYEEMRDDEEGSHDPVVRSVPPRIGTSCRRLSWLGVPMMSSWSWSAIGAGCFVLTVAWRCARYLELYSCA
eukprot:7082805-Heterocapsa_arctica.AAC.1